MRIIGSGLAGLIAGTINPEAEIFELMQGRNNHQALLRFRTPDIGDAVGIPFKKVTAYKGIWNKGVNTTLSPKMISLYSQKVSGKISHRSICNLEPETRYMAPIDFQDMLQANCHDRINYDQSLAYILRYDGPILSTIPMNVLARELLMEYLLDDELEIINDVRPVYVTRYHLLDCEAYMTYYYPDPDLNVYRASISGDTLIIESMDKTEEKDFLAVTRSFGLYKSRMTLQLMNHEQNNGKMKLIDERTRKKFILQATLEHGIYSVGRFAIWKDVVLDDVYQDLIRINKFINRDKYEHYRDLT